MAFPSWLLAASVAASAAVGLPDAAMPSQGSPGQGARDLSSCGRPGQPLCPMQAWMKTEVGAPLGEGKLDKVTSALRRLAAQPPDPGWVLWRTSATDGADAGVRGDVAAVRQSCRTCHDAYRTEYRKRFRTRPPPP